MKIITTFPSLFFRRTGFLVIAAFLLLRYILKLTRMFFTQVARGRIKLRDFDPDWAVPTHKIVRFLMVAFSIVIAYPYIPGSDSLAFRRRAFTRLKTKA